jgi:nitrogen regulatory protein PII
MTVLKVKGFGRQLGHAETYRGEEFSVDLLPKIKIELLVLDEDTDPLVEAIQKAAWTGRIGDGKIWGSAIEQSIRIRTRETGADSI